MRIATAHAYDSSLNRLQLRQQNLTDAQVRLTSGKRVERASDDPAAAARAERALASITRTEASQRALQASRAAMKLSESALGDGSELLQQARELIVSAGNASYTDAERATLAQSVRAIRNQLLAVANRNDGAGGHIFGGQGSASKPFVDAPGGVTFAGVNGNQYSASDEPLPLTTDGQAIWLKAPNAVSGGPDLSAFDVLDRVATELETTGRSSAAISAGVSNGLRDMDAISSNVLNWRARSGEVLNRADAIENRLAETRLGSQTEKSNAEDLDLVQAISDFQNQQTGYEAALKTYALVQRMSLFNYLQG